MSPPIPILLLKSPSQSSLDPYTTHFSPPRYSPTHIPPLSTTSLLPPELLSHHLLSSDEYSACIFTSQRAVASLLLAFQQLETDRRPTAARQWHIPLYAVGPGTATALRKDVVGADGVMPRCWVEGEEAGRGEALVEIIAARCHSATAEEEGGGEHAAVASKAKKKVLWFTGEKRRESLRTGLLDAGVDVDLCIVYRTSLSDSFPVEFSRALATTMTTTEPALPVRGPQKEEEEEEGSSGVRWVVIFSTQGVREVLHALGWLDENDNDDEGSKTAVKRGGADEEEEGRRRRSRRTFVASIGATTADYLEQEFGFRVDVCAEKPSPEGVRMGIERFIEERMGGL